MLASQTQVQNSETCGRFPTFSLSFIQLFIPSWGGGVQGKPCRRYDHSEHPWTRGSSQLCPREARAEGRHHSRMVEKEPREPGVLWGHLSLIMWTQGRSAVEATGQEGSAHGGAADLPRGARRLKAGGRNAQGQASRFKATTKS